MESPHNSNPEWSWDTRLIEVLQVDEDVGNLFMGKAQYNYSTLRSWADTKNVQAKERILRLSFRDIQRHNSNFKNGVKKIFLRIVSVPSIVPSIHCKVCVCHL